MSQNVRGRGRPWQVWPRVALFLLLGLLFLRFLASQRTSLSALFLPIDARTESAARSAELLCAADSVSASRSHEQSRQQCFGAALEEENVVRSGPAGAPLHIFLRVAAGERTHSGGRRFLGLRKTPLIMAMLASLRSALATLGGRGEPPASGIPSRVDITVIYDGLQNDARREKAWHSAVEALLVGGWSSPFPLSLQHIAASASGAAVGNRATNLLQYRLFRELPCAVMAAPQSARASSNEDTRVYFVEDDYVHAPTALAEMLEVLALPWLDGSEAAHFVTPFDHPDRLRAGGLNLETSTVKGGVRRAWRSQSSTTMTFACRCSDALRVLPTLEALAPDDFVIWPRLQWTRLAGVIIRERPENRLMGPTASLALHATAGDVPYYAPPGTGHASWCAFVLCLRDAASAFLLARAPTAFAILNESMG